MADEIKIEVSGDYRVIFLDSKFNPVDENKAVIAKIVNQGRVIFAELTEDDVTQNAFEGHRGRPGKRGGSLPRSAGTGTTTADMDEVESFIQGKIDSADRMNEKHPGIIGDDWIDKLNGAKKTYRKYVEKYGDEYPIVLIKEQPEVERRPWYGAIIAPSSKHSGEWQATYFDQRGFSGDFQTKTEGGAFWDVYSQGMTKPAPELLEEVSQTDIFQAGNMFTMLPQEERDNTSIEEILAKIRGNMDMARQMVTNRLIEVGFYQNAFPGHRGRPGKRGGSLPRSAGTGPTPQDEERLLRPDDVKSIARQMGYPENKIVPLQVPGETFVVGGVEFKKGGSYYEETREIVLYAGVLKDENLTREVMAHEIQHDRFVNFAKKLEEENAIISASIRSENKDEWLIRMDGSLSEGVDAADFPAYQISRKYLQGDEMNRLIKADGVTAYSSAYWNQYGTEGGDLYQAVDETLAEIARLQIRTKGDVSKIDPAWIGLFRSINKIYARKED
jgi:hypothetical protein